MNRDQLHEQWQQAIGWMRDANAIQRDGTITGLLNRIATQAMAEWHLDGYFEMVEQELTRASGLAPEPSE